MTQNHPIQKLKNAFHKLRSFIARKKYKDPQDDLTIIGVTGTDGKTTVTSMIYHVLHEAGLNVGFISTIKAKIGDEEIDTGLHVTTPEPWMVPKYLRTMADEGVDIVIMESTSNGLQQGRLSGIEFDSAIITNIKNDHLDYHGDWHNYADAKFQLLRQVSHQGYAVLNKDDIKSADWIKDHHDDLYQDIYVKWCSLDELDNFEHSIEGLKFEYMDKKFEIPIIGIYNLLNALQVINLCLRYTDIDKIADALRIYKTPEGRMQIMQRKPFAVIVDFAHTPQALESALKSINDVKKKNGRIITVFGCAGKRDKGRRKMGAVSCELGDITILTAEDPRDEELYDINDDILHYAKQRGGRLIYRFDSSETYNDIKFDDLNKSIEKSIGLGEKPVIAFDADDVSSRKDAIDFAIKIAKKDDIVFITGKGHEKSLAFGKKEVEFNWSDQVCVREILRS